MGKYSQMTIPRNLRAKIKLAMFYMVDVFVVLGMALVGYYENIYLFRFPLKQYVALMVFHVVLGIFFCLRPKDSPDKKMFQVIIQLFARDKESYVPISLPNGYKAKEE